MSIETLTAAILARMTETNKWQRQFLNQLFHLWLGIRGRLNFLNMSRQGDFTETSYHNQFQRGLNWLKFSSHLVNDHCLPERIVVFDPSHLTKSGKHTPGVGWHWSGKANRVEWGLEIGAFSAVDIANHTAMHLLAEQTTPEKVKAAGGQMAHYCQLVTQNAPQLRQISPWLVVDSFFSRQPFVDGAKAAGLELITRLRKDAVLLYPFLGPKSGKKGRPQKFAGRVNLLELDLQHFTPCPDEEGGKLVFEARLWVKAWKAWAKVVVVQTRDEHGKITAVKTCASTEPTIPGAKLRLYYKARFQAEFLFRDAKQHAGLEECQSRDEAKMHFHFNAALATVSLAKAVHWLTVPAEKRGPFSMSSIKTQYANHRLLHRFFVVFGINPNEAKNQKAILELYNYGKIAA